VRPQFSLSVSDNLDRERPPSSPQIDEALVDFLWSEPSRPFFASRYRDRALRGLWTASLDEQLPCLFLP